MIYRIYDQDFDNLALTPREYCFSLLQNLVRFGHSSFGQCWFIETFEPLRKEEHPLAEEVKSEKWKGESDRGPGRYELPPSLNGDYSLLRGSVPGL